MGVDVWTCAHTRACGYTRTSAQTYLSLCDVAGSQQSLHNERVLFFLLENQNRHPKSWFWSADGVFTNIHFSKREASTQPPPQIALR